MSVSSTCLLRNNTRTALSFVSVNTSNAAAATSAAILPAGAQVTLPTWEPSLLVLPNSAQTRLTPASVSSSKDAAISLGPRLLIATVGSTAARSLGFVVFDAFAKTAPADAVAGAQGRFVNASSLPVVVFGNTTPQAFITPLLLQPVLPGQQRSSFLMQPPLSDTFSITVMSGSAAATLSLPTLHASQQTQPGTVMTVPVSLDTKALITGTSIVFAPQDANTSTSASALAALAAVSDGNNGGAVLAVTPLVHTGTSVPTVAALGSLLGVFVVLFFVFLGLYITRVKCVPLKSKAARITSASTGGASAGGFNRRFAGLQSKW